MLQGRALPSSIIPHPFFIRIPDFLRREESSKEASTLSKASPYMERMQLTTGKDRPTSRSWYRSQSLCPKGRAMGFIDYAKRWSII